MDIIHSIAGFFSFLSSKECGRLSFSQVTLTDTSDVDYLVNDYTCDIAEVQSSPGEWYLAASSITRQ